MEVTPVSDVAWMQAILLIGEGGCGVACASVVAPVARLAGVMQFLARLGPLLCCDRQLAVLLATEAGLLDVLSARLPLVLEPLAGLARMGKVDMPYREVRRQSRCLARLTKVKAAAPAEAATGRDMPRLEAQLAGKAGGWLSALHPVAGYGLCPSVPNYSTLLMCNQGGPLLSIGCAGSPFPMCAGPVDVVSDHAVSGKK